jgi:hypothetical protein
MLEHVMGHPDTAPTERKYLPWFNSWLSTMTYQDSVRQPDRPLSTLN